MMTVICSIYRVEWISAIKKVIIYLKKAQDEEFDHLATKTTEALAFASKSHQKPSLKVYYINIIMSLN